MSQVLTIQLNDQAYAVLKQKAEVAGISLAEFVITSLERQYGLATDKTQRTEAEKEAARKRFRSHAGAISGCATGADNESIDADLAREYANNHEED